jgi:helicase
MAIRINFSRYTVVLNEVAGTGGNKIKIQLIRGKLGKDPKVKASLTCFVELEREGNTLRPSKFWIGEKDRKFLQPKEFIRLLRECIKVCYSKNSSEEFVRNLTSLARTFQIPSTKVERCDICDYCLVEGYITLLRQDNRYVLEGSTLCRECASSEVVKEVEFEGDKQASKVTRKQVSRILDKVKHVDKAIKFALYKKDLISHPELTLIDRIPAEPRRPTTPVDRLKIPQQVAQVLSSEGIKSLMPVQELAVKAGLLSGTSLLVVSATSSGKTLIGEFAGTIKCLQGEKMIYLAPLVALANQKYDEFRTRYSKIGLRTAIKVGMSKIDVGEDELVVVDGDIKAADIVSATYEGLDVILRSGRANDFGSVGVVIVDEVQMVSDPDRGPELDGLIARFRKLFPNSQLICLSATVGNPEELAKELGVSLVSYPGRPVPLERHLIVCFSEGEKLQALEQLVGLERRIRSSTGFHGQTIVFTNSRRRTHDLSNFLQSMGLGVTPYHAGMTYRMRKTIEDAFVKGMYDAVITTYALGAGFNAPASQVVFESCSMGNRYLTTSEFEQMMGRAGRLGMHERGKVVILAEQGRTSHGEKEETEEKVAQELLDGAPEEVKPEHDEDQCEAQILSDVSAFDQTGITVNELDKTYDLMLGGTQVFSEAIANLIKEGLVETRGEMGEQLGKMCFATTLGKATAISFLTPKETSFIRENAGKLDLLVMSLKLNPFSQVYISTRIQSELERAFNTRFSSNLFSGAVLDVMNVSKSGGHKSLPTWVLDTLVKWAREFFKCNCKENPFCDCGAQELCKKVVSLRLTGMTPREIAEKLNEDYEFQVYPGDLFDWFEQEIHRLRGIERIMKALGKDELAEQCEDLSKRIETPH